MWSHEPELIEPMSAFSSEVNKTHLGLHSAWKVEGSMLLHPEYGVYATQWTSMPALCWLGQGNSCVLWTSVCWAFRGFANRLKGRMFKSSSTNITHEHYCQVQSLHLLQIFHRTAWIRILSHGALGITWRLCFSQVFCYFLAEPDPNGSGITFPTVHSSGATRAV